MTPPVRDLLRSMKPLHTAPEDHVFTNARGGPIDQREWPRDRWHAALRACEIRPRKFYATRHTFISDALTKGLNVTFIAEYTGTSLAMIEQHYGRFLEAEAGAQLRLLDAAKGRG